MLPPAPAKVIPFVPRRATCSSCVYYEPHDDDGEDFVALLPYGPHPRPPPEPLEGDGECWCVDGESPAPPWPNVKADFSCAHYERNDVVE